MTGLTHTVRRLYAASPALTVVSLLMLPALAGALAGLALDPRLITGAPAWLKPAKFAASTAIYGLTLAWAFTYLGNWPRLTRVVGGITAAVFVGEIAIIDLQAWRGTTSHFNVATPFDAALFMVMGGAILLQTVSSIAVAVALWRERFADAALGFALRAGLTITIIGAFTGGLMTRPTAPQLAAMQSGARPVVIGGHTVGAADGQAGLPVTGWSAAHGDLRAPHFVGLHAFQVLPLLAVVVRRRAGAAAARVVRMASFSYAVLFVLLLAEALAGVPVAAPDPGFAVALTIWTVVTIGGLGVALASGSRGHQPIVTV